MPLPAVWHPPPVFCVLVPATGTWIGSGPFRSGDSGNGPADRCIFCTEPPHSRFPARHVVCDPVTFTPLRPPPYLRGKGEGSGTMMITLGPGITLHPGSFTAVIAPEEILAAALTGSPALRKFLILFVSVGPGLSGRAGAILPYLEIRAAPSAGDLVAALQGARQTLVLVGHDPALFEGAGERPAVAGALREAGRSALVILHATTRTPSFDALARSADRTIEIIPAGGPAGRRARAVIPAYCSGTTAPRGQTLLEVS